MAFIREQIKPNEVTEIIAGFNNPNSVLGSGVHLDGVKYLTLQANDRSIYAKKVKEQAKPT